VITLAARTDAARRRVSPFAAEFPFAPQFLGLDGAAMHYVDEGPRDGETLLFLHGNPTWSFLWRNLIKSLRGRYRCVAPDHIGCGLSDKPEAYRYRLDQHIANQERLVTELGLARVTLVVHDWGGAVGFGLAQRRPELVARAIVMNTAAFTGGRAPLSIRACRTPLLGPLAVRGLNLFARAATHMATERGVAREVRRGLLAPYASWSERVATLRFVEDIPLSPRHPSWPTLRAIEEHLPCMAELPLCLIWGRRDWCFTPRFLEEWQRRFPRARVHVADAAGHWVTEDARDAVQSWVARFLDDHPLRP
jgi:haloalkane dehalogenase